MDCFVLQCLGSWGVPCSLVWRF